MPLNFILSLLLLAVPAPGTLPAEVADADHSASAPADSQPAGTLIEGIVTNSMGGGVGHAKVRLERIEPPGTLIGETTTNHAGEIALRLKHPFQEKVAARVTITREGFTPFSQDIEIDPQEDLPYIDATMTGSAQLKGQVRRASDNAPVPDALVRCTSNGREIKTTSDRNGRFTIEGVDRGSAVLIVTAAGWATAKQEVKVDQQKNLVFVELEPQRPLRIVATRTDGKPAAELIVEMNLEPSNQWQEITTDAQGKADLIGVPATTQKLHMRYNGPEYVQMSDFNKVFTLPKAKAAASQQSQFTLVDIPLKVELSATVQGKVVDAAGKPILGVRVIAGREPYGYMPMIWTASDGTYELTGVSPGVTTISFQHSEYATGVKECTLQAGQSLNLDASLENGQLLAGKVLDEDKHPIAGAWITVESWKGYATLGMRTVANEDGSFEFPHAPPGELQLAIEKPGYALAKETFKTGAPSRDVTLKKSEEGEANGAGGAPPAKLKVGDAVPEITLTGTDGKTYKLSELKGKHVFLECWASWCGPCMGEVPNIKALRAATKDQKDFIMIGINLDRDRAAFDKAIAKEEIDWPQATGAASGAEKAFGTLDGFAIPYMCLIGPDGKLVAQGLRGPKLAEEVNKHLKK